MSAAVVEQQVLALTPVLAPQDREMYPAGVNKDFEKENSMSAFKKIFIFGMCLLLSKATLALDANKDYTVTLAKVNSNGTTTNIETVNATSDSNGKISFSFTTGVPTADTTNFIAITIKNEAGTVVRQSLAPAPDSTSTTLVGVNGLSDTQAKAMLEGFVAAGTDDPIYASFGFMLLKSSQLSSSDRSKITTGGRNAILGSGGFVDFLQTSGGVTASQLTTFKQKIVSNTTSNTRDLADYCSNFKTAVDNDDADSMAKAGGFIADIFIDAANAAGFDVGLIPSALDSAGEVANADDDLAGLSSAANTIVNQALSSLFLRIAAVKINKEYTTALTTLGASGSQVDRYNSAVTTMLTAFEAIDTQFRADFENQTMDSAKQSQINTLFQTAFSAFETNIASTNAEISAMKTAFATAMGIVENTLPTDFGTFRDENGASKNWPIPMTVLHNWAATTATAGGSVTYTRDTLDIPVLMSWLGARTSFGAGPVIMQALLGLHEDIQIIQFTYFSTFSGGGPVTPAVEKAAKLLMQQRIDSAVARLGGTTDGSAALTDAHKKAIVKVMLEPNFN
ncbi:MAG: hypothetical protein A2W61_00295 [Deltaproteobacteria bacterium RIFCSPLOWO2_01_44_7]|nr:MAG: hypothetical protein A2W61_00295 [Deltaproteobacteria bacterium RIFCSPLOWO2_01_44_7]